MLMKSHPANWKNYQEICSFSTAPVLPSQYGTCLIFPLLIILCNRIGDKHVLSTCSVAQTSAPHDSYNLTCLYRTQTLGSYFFFFFFFQCFQPFLCLSLLTLRRIIFIVSVQVLGACHCRGHRMLPLVFWCVEKQKFLSHPFVPQGTLEEISNQ